jgi:hypothetical protein
MSALKLRWSDERAREGALYAAGSGLHPSVDRVFVIEAIQEIVTYLIGSEQFAVVRADDALTPLALFGVDAARLSGLTPHTGIIGTSLSERRTVALPRGVPADASCVRACVPLVVGGEVRGFVLIFDFLPVKGELSAIDHELFALVSSQAALVRHF